MGETLPDGDSLSKADSPAHFPAGLSLQTVEFAAIPAPLSVAAAYLTA